MTKVAVIQTSVPPYRVAVFDAMSEALGPGLRIYAGMTDFESGIGTSLEHVAWGSVVRNRFGFGERVLWQDLPFRDLVRAETVIASINPRIFSTWVILILRALRHRRTVLWGHAWPRDGREVWSDKVRHLQRRLASTIVVYTERERCDLATVMDKPVLAAPNALYTKAQMRATPPASGEPSTFLYVGRLASAKKPDLLLRAFAAARDELPSAARVVYVGAGPEEGRLRDLTEGLGLEGRVDLVGYVEPGGLGPFYAEAIATVCPGYVGLSLIQSLSFGVPMLFGRDEPHAPEIEAADEDVRAQSFASDSVPELAAKLICFSRMRRDLLRRRPEISRWCAENYSVDAMAARLVAAVAPGPGDGAPAPRPMA